MITHIKISQLLLLLLVPHLTGSLAFLGSPSMNKSPWSLGDFSSQQVHGTDDHGTRTAVFAGCDDGNFPEPRVLRNFEELMNDRFTEDFGISSTAAIESNGFTDLQIDEIVESANLEPDNGIPKQNGSLLVTQSKTFSLVL